LISAWNNGSQISHLWGGRACENFADTLKVKLCHEIHTWLIYIYSHPKGNGGTKNTDFAAAPGVVSSLSFIGIQFGVIKGNSHLATAFLS
jgi:hypothetical protein